MPIRLRYVATSTHDPYSHAFDQTGQTGGARQDVQQANAGAPADTGFSEDIWVFLSGRSSGLNLLYVCAFAIDDGAEVLLGCITGDRVVRG